MGNLTGTERVEEELKSHPQSAQKTKATHRGQTVDGDADRVTSGRERGGPVTWRTNATRCAPKRRDCRSGADRGQSGLDWIGLDTVKITIKRREGDDHQAENEERIQEPLALECKHRVRLNWNLEIKLKWKSK